MGPTGVSALNIGGSTISSKLHLYTVGEFTDLTNEAARKFCNEIKDVKFVIIDEYSMVGCTMLGKIDARLRQATGKDEDFGGLFCYLCGDLRQLPPVRDSPLYTDTIPSSQLGKAGKKVWDNIDASVILHEVHRQTDMRFKILLENVSKGTVTDEDYELLTQRFVNNVSTEERNKFQNTIKLYPTKKKVQALNEDYLSKLRFVSNNEPVPVAIISASNNCREAAEDDEAQGLENIIYLGPSCKILLRANLWTEKGLVNGAVGTVVDIIYDKEKKPPNDMPAVLICKFENYTGPYLGGDANLKLVPIPVITKSWNIHGVQCSRTQFPVQLAYAVTIHKSQGLTLLMASY